MDTTRSECGVAYRWMVLAIAMIVCLAIAMGAVLWWNSPSVRWKYRGEVVQFGHWYTQELYYEYALIEYSLKLYKCRHGDYPKSIEEWTSDDPRVTGLLFEPLTYGAGTVTVHLRALESQDRLLLVEEPGFLIEFEDHAAEPEDGLTPWKSGTGLFNDFQLGDYTEEDVRASVLFEQAATGAGGEP